LGSFQNWQVLIVACLYPWANLQVFCEKNGESRKVDTHKALSEKAIKKFCMSPGLASKALHVLCEIPTGFRKA